MKRPEFIYDGQAVWLIWGRLCLSLWGNMRVWGLGFHREPCCAFCLNLGPLEIMVSPR